MKVHFRKSFARDLKGINEPSVLAKVKNAIEEAEKANRLDDIGNLSKISGAQHCYRIRIGDYRLGLVVERDEIEFVRCLHRRDIYRYFP